MTALLASPLAAQEVRVIVSSSEGDRLAVKSSLQFHGSRAPGEEVRVDASRRYQKIEGFGATFNEAGLLALAKAPVSEQERVLEALFDAVRGAGFTLMKSPLAGCDFASAGPMYFYSEVPGDTQLLHFSIARDLKPTGMITYIRLARRYGQFQIQATTDYPPDWMLDASMNLKPEHYDTFARYLARYLHEYEKQGVTIDYLSPLNEPQEIYCPIRYEQIRDLIKDHIGPTFGRARVKTRIQLSDSNNRAIALKYFPVVLSDSSARKYISTMPVHGYYWDRDGSSPMSKLHELYPDIPIWQTEVCHIRQTTVGKRRVPVLDFEDGDWWGRMLVEDLRNWASGWIYWNAVLDQKGGPWMIDLKHHNPEVNNQHPLVIVDSESGKAVFTGLYYYLAHFSKFVRPGAVRIDASSGVPDLSSVAFEDASGAKVLEVVNSSKARRRFTIRDGGGVADAELPGLSIGTFIWNSIGDRK